MAQLLDRLTQAGVAIIGWDIVFAESDRTSPKRILKQLGIDRSVQDYDTIFAQAIANSPSILGYAFDFLHRNDKFFSVAATIAEHGKNKKAIPVAKGVILNIEPIQQSAYSSGFFNMIPDSDGVVRSVPLLIRYEDFLYPSLMLEIYRILQNVSKIDVFYNELGVSSIGLDKEKIATDLHGRLVINFRGEAKSYSYISAVDILKDRVDPALFEGKIALIGTSATGLLDLRTTPFENTMPGVEIHANILDNLIHQDYLLRPSWLTLAELLAMAVVALSLFLAFLFFRPLFAVLFAVLLVVGIWGFGYYLFYSYKIVSEPAAILSLALVVGFVQTGVYLYFVNRQKEIIKAKFAAKVSKSVVEELIKNPNGYLIAREKEVTLFFSDIRNFTDRSEEIKDPKLLAHWLNLYLTPMSEIILKYKGTLDKFIGDAIMAYWNAPLDVAEHADKALQSALEQLRKLQELNEVLKKEGLPIIEVGMGLHTDRVTVGEMGSRIRSDYTAVGEGVNLASRLEGLNKYYGTMIILSEAVYRCLRHTYYIRYLDRVQVKGMRRSVTIYEAALKPFDDIELYMQAQRLYQEGRFEEAYKYFMQLFQESNDVVAKQFAKRCNLLKEQRESFDGVYRFETK